MKKRKIRSIGGLAAAGFTLAVLALGFHLSVQARPEMEQQTDLVPRPVKYMVLQEKTMTDTRTFPGVVDLAGETRLSFRVSGPLLNISAATGRQVRKGEVLARVDPRDFKINITRLKASLEEARATLSAMEKGARQEDIEALMAQVDAGRANLTRSRKQKERFDMLIKKQFVTREEHDRIIADFQTRTAQYNVALQNLKKAKAGSRHEDILAAKARIKQLKAGIAEAENALADTTLKAPFDGIINQRLAEKHETVSMGAPVLTILDSSSVDIKTDIPEEVMLGRNRFTKITCTFDAYPEESFEAQIKEIGLKPHSSRQSFPLTVSLLDPGAIDLQAGMAASVKIHYQGSEAMETGFPVPPGAVFKDAGNRLCAWKIDHTQMTVLKVFIQSSRLKGDKLLITSDLKAGERLVTAGAGFLIQGQAVRLMEPEQGS